MPARADRWNDGYVRVMLTPVERGRDVVWLRPRDVRRRLPSSPYPVQVDWMLEHAISDRWVIVNRTGSTVRMVTFSADGPIFVQGKASWEMTAGPMAPRDSVALTATRGVGSGVSQLRVAWRDDVDPSSEHTVTIDWPV